jgi:hypothetical protein
MKMLILALGLFAFSASARGEDLSQLDRLINEYTPYGESKKGYCGDPCIITYNEGGYIYTFLQAARRIHEEPRPAIINGPCGSACTIFADFARPYVCITPRASFHFHMAYHEAPRFSLPPTPWTWGALLGAVHYETVYREPPQSPEITSWVYAHGGFPIAANIKDFLSMSAYEASRFWPMCDGIPHPRLRPEWPPNPHPRPPR